MKTPTRRLVFTCIVTCVGSALAQSFRTVGGTLNACPSTGPGLLSTECGRKLSLTTHVQNGQNDTTPLSLAVSQLNDCTSTSGSCTSTTLENSVTMTITRTPVFFKYPTVYSTTVNYQRYEVSVRVSPNAIPLKAGVDDKLTSYTYRYIYFFFDWLLIGTDLR